MVMVKWGNNFNFLLDLVICYNTEKAEHQRIDAFELWCWRRLLRVPWTARRSNQSIREINPEYSLEGLMLGKIEGGRRGRQRMRWLDGINDSMDMC